MDNFVTDLPAAASEVWPPAPPAGAPSPPSLTHHQKLVRLAQAISIVLSVGAGIGLTWGLFSPRDGVGGIIVPIVSGVVLGAALAAGWHIALTLAARVRTPLGYVGTVAGAIVIGVIAVAGSSWGIATALSGRPALRAYQAYVATTQGTALDLAWAGADTEHGVILAVRTAAAEWQGLANHEANGGCSRHRGSGLIVGTLTDAATRYGKLAGDMQGMYNDVAASYARALEALQLQHAAIGHDDDAYAKYANEVPTQTSRLNAFRLTPFVATGGPAKVELPTADLSTVKCIEKSIDAISAELQGRAKDIADKRKQVDVPTYVPIEARTATWDYAGSAALGGFVTAVGIDLTPLVFVIMLLLSAREPLVTCRSDPPIDEYRNNNGYRHPPG